MIIVQYNNEIVGSIKVLKMENNTLGEFGMLVVNPDYRGKRLGSGLVEEAENWAKSWGAHTMQLELLTPRTFKHDSKEFLK